MKKRGFTLVEILIAVCVTTFIISGISVFMAKVTDSIFNSQNKAKVSLSLSDFMERMNSSRIKFSTGTIIDTPGYDAILLTSSGGTAGLLVGVVGSGQTGSGYFLDQNTPFDANAKKVLAVQELTASQVTKAKTSTGAYLIPFQEDTIFENLVVKNFSVTSYQSGAIFDVSMDIYNEPLPAIYS